MYQESARYREELQTYIEATYHLSDSKLVRLRAEPLGRPGAISQDPYIESTPRYSSERRFEALDVPAEARGLLTLLGTKVGGGLLFDPPYAHQASALEETLRPPFKDLVVTTGTGSGKTETFPMPILGRMAVEACKDPSGPLQATGITSRGSVVLSQYPPRTRMINLPDFGYSEQTVPHGIRCA